MSLFGPDGAGTTALPDELQDDLVPTWISTVGELYEAEEEAITAGTLGLRPSLDDLFDDLYLCGLHRAMLRDVWRWAGTYRRHDANIGIAWPQIPTEVRSLLGDVRAWVDHETWPPEQIALRFHHRLEYIHPFPNGNGRFGRIAADYLVTALGAQRFTWGATAGLDTGELRVRYLDALRRMDRDADDINELVVFARS